MATIYVDSNAVGTNDGSSWANAYALLSSADTAAVGGDTVLIASNHTESTISTYTFASTSAASPITIISSNSGTSAYQAGAYIGRSSTTAGISIQGNIICHGVSFVSAYTNGINNHSGADRQAYYDCSFISAAAYGFWLGVFVGATTSWSKTIFENCTFNLTAGSPNNRLFRIGGHVIIKKCVFTNFDHLVAPGSSYATGLLEVSDCDLSSFAPLYDSDLGTKSISLRLFRCKLHASWVFYDGVPVEAMQVSSIEMSNCDIGTLSGASLGMTGKWDFLGSAKEDASRYRTGGANNGTVGYSWELATTSSAKESDYGFESPPILRWANAGSQNLTLYVASGVTLNNDDFWIDVSSPGEGGSPTAQGTFNTTRAAPLATPAALTTDAVSTWNGAGVGTKQKITVAINPAVAGPVTVRCFLAKPSTTVYVDPKLEIA